ncbi:MAG: discoidin domain-containing protein [Dysgonomonas sp.]
MNLKLSFILLFSTFAITANAQKSKLSLNSDSQTINWKVKAQAEAGEDISKILSLSYDMSDWVEAVVPGTVFGSYVEAGLEKDPNFGDNAYTVDKTKYDRNFWYRTEFETPITSDGEILWLNFEGINRKGEIYFNGNRLGLLDGFMDRGKFDITPFLNKKGKNVLVILVYWVGVPVPNHASPTYISSASWDWMPYVPGLLSGITDDVYLTTSREVSLVDPWIRSKVPSEDKAILQLQIGLSNNTTSEQTGTLSGVIQPGNIEFSKEIRLGAGQQKPFELGVKDFSQFEIKDPKLWWPNGYGEPDLYTCDLTYTVNGEISDTKKITFGIREYAYEYVDDVFRIKINGKPIYIKGGNWGMSEYMLRCRGEEYDLKIRLHKEMNMNMIRNWIGSVTDEEFYDACDKYGILVWDDFWLNSHKNLPDDVQAFNNNAIEKIKRLRNHPSIAVWCGENEGYPLPPLNNWLDENVKYFDGGDRHYHANSNSDGLSGSGPWGNYHPSWYFSKYPMAFGYKGRPGWGFRTEIGTAVFTTFESFKKFMPKDSWWPRNEMWNLHFFGSKAANANPDRYFNMIGENYGKPTDIEDFCRKAQLVNLESNKAMFEGWQDHMWNDASGIMTWMSQSAYPSFVWQTYDYYYDLTGAYWGVKKALEHMHIQWSYADNSVKVINTTLEDIKALNAKATVYNMQGKEMAKYVQQATMDVKANGATHFFDMNFTTDNIAYKKKVIASSTSNDAGGAEEIADGSDGSRWASNYSDNEWVYIDLGKSKEIGYVTLKWEDAHAEYYKLQISDDANNWQDVYENTNSKGGNEDIRIKPVTARYVKMLGIKRATQWGYSLYEFEVYGKKKAKSDLTPVHFIKLELTDNKGNLVSDNFYWRSTVLGDYTALNKLPKAKLEVKSSIETRGNKKYINAIVRNIGSSTAFAIYVQPYRKSDGERILPIIMNDNYFTLFSGEKKELEIEFDADFLPNDDYKLEVIPYNK